MNQRIAVGANAPTISATFRNGNGVPTDVGVVTVAVEDWAGTAVTTGAVTGSGGVYTATITDALTAPTLLTATWTASGPKVVTSTVDVVGQRLLWPDEFITSPGVSYPERAVTEVSDAIAWFEDLATRHMGWSPIERFRQTTVRASGCDSLMLPDPYVLDLLGVTWQASGVADVIASEDELALLEVNEAGVLVGSYVTRKALVAYTHGNAAGGQDLHDAAKDAVRVHLQEQVAGRPALSVSDGLTFTRFSTAGPGRPTGIPEVDEVLNGLRFVAVA